MKTSINAIHHQAADWLRELEFYRQELSIFRKRLEEVAAKNNAQEVMAQVEHFQNKFIMLVEQHDIIKHEVGEKARLFEEMAKSKPEHIDEKFVSETGELGQKTNGFFNTCRDTRKEFNTFLAKTL